MSLLKRLRYFGGLSLLSVMVLTACNADTQDTQDANGDAADSNSEVENDNGDDEGSEEVEGNITVAGWEFIESSLTAALDDFNAEYPNVEVSFEVAPPADLYRNLLLNLSAGSGAADVVAIEGQELARFVETGELYDITDRVEPYIDDFNDFKWADGMMDDQIYAMPWDSGPVGLYYRRDVFEEAGLPSDPESVEELLATWDDYIETAGIITEETDSKMLALPNSPEDGRLFDILMQQIGTWYFNDDGEVIVNNEDSERVLEFMETLWENEYTEDTSEWSDGWYASLSQGNVATLPMAVWMGGFLREWIAPEAEGDWGVVPLPVWDEGGYRTANDGGSTLVITEQSENKEAAWAFVEFMLTREESQLAMFEATDAFPSLETTYDDSYFDEEAPYFGGQAYRRLFADLVQEVPNVNYTGDYSEAYNLSLTELSRLGTGQQSVQETLEALESEIQSRTGR